MDPPARLTRREAALGLAFSLGMLVGFVIAVVLLWGIDGVHGL